MTWLGPDILLDILPNIICHIIIISLLLNKNRDNFNVKAKKKQCDEVQNMADKWAAILVIIGQTKICISAVHA